MLERMKHSDAAFVSLSYSDDHLPVNAGSGSSLRPVDCQLWLKKLRFKLEPLRIRFFLVGEYGGQTHRPHYHVILFGFLGCHRGMTLKDPATGRPLWSRCCPNCKLIGDTWGKGDVYLGQVTKASAAYTAEYTIKKMTSADDPRLKGRHPEFARMSLRPGIGADAAADVIRSLKTYNGLDEAIDVPLALAHGKSNMPLGRYLRGRIRLGLDREKTAPPEVIEDITFEMSLLRAQWWETYKHREEDFIPFKDWLVLLTDADFRTMAARNEIFKSRKSL